MPKSAAGNPWVTRLRLQSQQPIGALGWERATARATPSPRTNARVSQRTTVPTRQAVIGLGLIGVITRVDLRLGPGMLVARFGSLTWRFTECLAGGHGLTSALSVHLGDSP
jgi:hypothetical protein